MTMSSKNNSRSVKPSFITLPNQDDKNITILEFLGGRFPHIQKDVWQIRIDNGLILDPDGKAITQSTNYKAGIRLKYFREATNEIKIPFEGKIIFQNENILVACKPHFLPVQPSGQFVNESLLNRLTVKFNNFELVPLHRIDRETAGLVLFSKNPKNRDAYHQLFRTGSIRKTYEAIGTEPKEKNKTNWLIENRIEESDQWPKMKNCDGPINARTIIEKTDKQNGMVKFKIEPLTGKGHQIRLHLQLIGSNIINDRYHPKLQPQRLDDYDNPLQLIAKELEFDDPISGEHFRFESLRRLLF